MVEQSADVGVVQGLGSGSVPVGLRDLRIGHKGLDERFQMRVLQGGDKVAQGLPELVNILGGLRKIVGEVDFGSRLAGEACGS